MHSRADLLQLFALRLQDLRLRAGKPSLQVLGRINGDLKRATISDVLHGKSAPTIDFVLAFARACEQHAAQKGIAIDASLTDPQALRDLWMILQRDLGAIRRSRTIDSPGEVEAPRNIEEMILTVDGSPPAVSTISDPRLLGVHGSGPPGGDTELPVYAATYVARDVDSQLRLALVRPGFFLLIGDSTAGKSRTAFEAIRQVAPAHILLAPQDHTGVAAAAQMATTMPKCVLWLDNLENFLGPRGLTRALIAQILVGPGHHRIIMATMRAAEIIRYSGSPSDPSMHSIAPALNALAQANRFHLDRILTTAEVSRTRDLARSDIRLHGALRHLAQIGLAEYLAAGPHLVSAWKESKASGQNPRGVALLQAAIDCHRAGLTRPLPRQLIEAVADSYPTGTKPQTQATQDGWTWALAAIPEYPSFMSHTGGDRYAVFDYLVDFIERSAARDEFPSEQVLALAIPFTDLDEALRVGATAFDRGRFNAAAAAFQHAYDLAAKTRSDTHPVALDARDRHAFVLRRLGRLSKAETEHRAVMELRISHLGPEHPDTLVTRNNWAATLYQQGRWQDAEREFGIVLQQRLALLGPDDPQTLRSYSNHGTVLYDLGRWSEALHASETALSGRLRILGDQHPHTLISRNNFGLVVHAAGRWEAALQEHTIALGHRQQNLGLEHPDTLESRHNRASALNSLGRHQEARDEFAAVLESRRQRLGPHHPDTIDTATRTAAELCVLGKLIQAEELSEATLDLALHHLGEDHPYTLDARDGQGIILAAAHQYQAAIAEHQATVEARTRLLGSKHPYTLRSTYHLAAAEIGARNTSVASQRLSEIYAYQASGLGTSHPDTQATWRLLQSIQT